MLTTANGSYYGAGELPVSAPQSVKSPYLSLIQTNDERSASSKRALRAQRALNVVVAIAGLILAAPIMLLIALAIKLTSPGPVLYRQTRVGVDRRTRTSGNWRRRIDYGGRLFTIYKFRTMTVQPPQLVADEVWARPDDPRVTPMGRLLRKYRLDELPQLVNVLRGDMNVVGPRPEQPKMFVRLRDQIEGYSERQRVLPGITGLAQVNLHYDTCVDDVRNKLRFDLEYAARVSALQDLRILAKTIPVVVFRRGAW